MLLVELPVALVLLALHLCLLSLGMLVEAVGVNLQGLSLIGGWQVCIEEGLGEGESVGNEVVHVVEQVVVLFGCDDFEADEGLTCQNDKRTHEATVDVALCVLFRQLTTCVGEVKGEVGPLARFSVGEDGELCVQFGTACPDAIQGLLQPVEVNASGEGNDRWKVVGNGCGVCHPCVIDPHLGLQEGMGEQRALRLAFRVSPPTAQGGCC